MTFETDSLGTGRGQRQSRRVPLQARGHATVEAILDAAARLVAELGHEAVNTNLIAAESGINIATLYQYFANKQTIIIALFDRQAAARQLVIADVLQGMSGRSWEAVIADTIATAFALHHDQVGATAVRRAIRATPELRAHGEAVAVETAEGLANLLSAVTGTPLPRARQLARCVVEIIGALVDIGPSNDTMIVAECQAIVTAYLGRALGPPHLTIATAAGPY